MKEKIIIEDIPITLERKKIKNMYLRVLPPFGEVKVSAPLFVSDKDIFDFSNDWEQFEKEYSPLTKIKLHLILLK